MQKNKDFIKMVMNNTADRTSQIIRITRSNQGQFVHRTAAVFLGFCLILYLLPGFATAQDWSTQEARAAWLIGQYQGESIGFNDKFGGAKALARLALNPNDAYVIDRITRYYDNVPEGTNAQQFSYAGVAWVLGKYWDKFTPAQRDHPKDRLKSFSDLLGHGTENLNNNIYRAPIRPDKPGTNELTAATDPKFIDAGAGGLKFKLRPDSPAIDRGAVIRGVTDGYVGNAPDIGAYEYGGEEWVAGCADELLSEVLFLKN